MLVDYYTILNCNIHSSSEEIKTNFRKLAKLKHPDVNKSPNSNEEFRLLFEAYEILINPISKKKYDEQWKNYYGTHNSKSVSVSENLFDKEKNKSNKKSKYYSKMHFEEFNNSSFSDIDFVIKNSVNISFILVLCFVAFLLISIPILINDTGNNYLNLLIVVLFFGLCYFVFRLIKQRYNALKNKYKVSKSRK